jgi:phosphatidylserine/phosphatidylglycerophosphate/cardiolipin synthase-like enzyme
VRAVGLGGAAVIIGITMMLGLQPAVGVEAAVADDTVVTTEQLDEPPPGTCVVQDEWKSWTPPAGSAWKPPAGATFNHPRGTPEARWRIVRAVDKAVNNTWPCETIWMTLYLMDSKPSVEALIKAHARGVRVRVVLDNVYANNTLTQRLYTALNADNGPAAEGDPEWWGPDGSFVTYCTGSCRGSYGVSHSKFYVFSKTGAAENVSMVSSSNLNAGGAHKGWNDLYVANGRADLVEDPHAGFATIHDEMAEDVDVFPTRYREMTRGAITTRFFPTDDGRDPVFDDLSTVRCRGVASGFGRNGRTAIDISMFQWMHDRGIRFAHKVAELGRNGCDVRVIYGAPGREVRKILHKAARRGHIKVWNSRFDLNGDGEVDYRVHHKYVLVNGVFRGSASVKGVLTGAQNWSGNSTRGTDENTISVMGAGAYNQYMGNWNLIRNGWSLRVR